MLSFELNSVKKIQMVNAGAFNESLELNFFMDSLSGYVKTKSNVNRFDVFSVDH